MLTPAKQHLQLGLKLDSKEHRRGMLTDNLGDKKKAGYIIQLPVFDSYFHLPHFRSS